MPRQESFAGGELAPELWARTGFTKYAIGVRRLHNFIPIRAGAAMSRPGSEYLGPVKGGDVASGSSTKVRLVPFIYSDASTEQNYVLEFGNLYVRLWNAGTLVLNAGVPLELVTPYATVDLPLLKWAQVGDVMTLCHPAHPPAELTRLAHTNWTYGAITFNRPAPMANSRVLTTPFSAFVTDAQHPAREWQWQVTEVRKDSRGVVFESAPEPVAYGATIGTYDSAVTYGAGSYVLYDGDFYVSLAGANTGHSPPSSPTWWSKDNQLATATIFTAPKSFVLYPDKPPIVVAIGSYYPNLDTDPNFISYRVYRGRSGLFGWVGDTKTATFTDTGETPDYAQPPPQGTNPFNVFAADGSLTRTEYPSSVTIFEERRCFARTNQRPGFLWLSSTGDYSNFDERLVPVADEALKFELAAHKREQIRSILGLEKLLAFTDSSVWAIGGGGGPLTFDAVDAKRQTGSVGSTWLAPLDLDTAVLYVAAQGCGVRAIGFDWQRQSFAGADISLLAQHLFRGHQVVDWTFSKNPWSLVWAVRDDGVLLSLTFDQQQDVTAWAWHDTEGTVENVCAVPEGTENYVYLVVSRTANDVDGNPRTVRYVERFRSRVLPTGQDGNPDVTESFALDCSKSYSGAPVTTVTGLSHLAGQSVYAVADGVVVGPLTVDNLGSLPLGLPDGASVVHVGVLFEPEIETLDPSTGEGRAKQKNIVWIGFEVLETRGLSVGPDFGHLVPWKQRKVADNYGPPGVATDLVRVDVKGKWGVSARACLRQTLPLPVTILGLTFEVDSGAL